MNHGTGPAVLVSDLLDGDGPFIKVADDFVVQRCASCRVQVEDDLRYRLAGLLCEECAVLARAS